MEKLTLFPLRAQEDALKRALIAGGFTLLDDGTALEIETPDWAIELFKRPEGASRKPIMLEDGNYALRSELLAAQLSKLQGGVPCKAFSAGTVYDGRDEAHPAHRVIQGVWIAESLSARECARFAGLLAEAAFGIGATVDVEGTGNVKATISATVDDKTFQFATAGKASAMARALLGIAGTETAAWFFEIDVDAVTMATYGIESRDELYSPLVSKLKGYEGNAPTFGGLYFSRASNVLRKLGFCEFAGLPVYESDCYVKMNMIQEAWDTNNVGVKVDEPLGAYTGLPTVLTPALEEALAANWKAGEQECKIFEIRHIFLPGRDGNDPIEKVALSFGAYGPEIDKVAWRKIVDEFLTEFGIDNHFFMPIPPGVAPAYHPADSWVLMDQNMTYLESNFGSISPVALENHGIGTQAFMAQFEFAPIEKKAIEEFDFVLPDYQ